MREELLLKYLAELQRHEGKHFEFQDRIHRVCDQIEKEIGVEREHNYSKVTISPKSMPGTRITPTKNVSVSTHS
ncbi:hypothetical protein [Rossellomorea marisflavi]|uniref:hypothetical protein n=1 Tax=Rossellomorea marisflavi TaxID=189381 RepID=UPI00345C69ED